MPSAGDLARLDAPDAESAESECAALAQYAAEHALAAVPKNEKLASAPGEPAQEAQSKFCPEQLQSQ